MERLKYIENDNEVFMFFEKTNELVRSKLNFILL
jgi:hypothetical protein